MKICIRKFFPLIEFLRYVKVFSPLYALFLVLDTFLVNRCGNFLIGFRWFSELVFWAYYAENSQFSDHTIQKTSKFSTYYTENMQVFRHTMLYCFLYHSSLQRDYKACQGPRLREFLSPIEKKNFIFEIDSSRVRTCDLWHVKHTPQTARPLGRRCW